MISFSTSYYESVHGKKPRGQGYWFFLFKYNGTTERLSYAGTYGEAKKLARADARFRRCTDVAVCS